MVQIKNIIITTTLMILSLFMISSTMTSNFAYAQYNDPDYTTVEDAAGKKRTLQDQSTDDYVTVEDAAGKNKILRYNKRKYSTAFGFFISIFPFYSGSFNVGFNGVGLYFVLTKIGSLGGALALYFIIPSYDPSKVEQLQNSFYFLVAFFASSTLGDMIYSAIHVRYKRQQLLNRIQNQMKQRMKRRKKSSSLINKGRNYAFNVFPRINIITNDKKYPSSYKIVVDGINVSAQLRF